MGLIIFILLIWEANQLKNRENLEDKAKVLENINSNELMEFYLAVEKFREFIY
jgi:hypothetical protein